MTKTPISLRTNDLTLFARALARQLGEHSPSHLSLMNMLARSAGYQNVQHMRAALAAEKRLGAREDAPVGDARLVERTLHQFDDRGRLNQWPAKRAIQTLALWGLWATLPARVHLTERMLNDHLANEHLFADPATLRRTLVACGLVSRKSDGTDYQRIEQEPPTDAKAVMHLLATRRSRRAALTKELRHA